MSREYVKKMISDLVSMDAESYAQCKAALLAQVGRDKVQLIEISNNPYNNK